MNVESPSDAWICANARVFQAGEISRRAASSAGGDEVMRRIGIPSAVLGGSSLAGRAGQTSAGGPEGLRGGGESASPGSGRALASLASSTGGEPASGAESERRSGPLHATRPESRSRG